MKKYKIVIQFPAKKDVKESRNWYNHLQKGLGKRFTDDLKKTLLSISNNPTSFAIRYAQNRKANLSKFPYGVFFFIDDSASTVFIIAVKHNARDFLK
jgi:mRNA-degrading endonuclease RelE of RelBE toxin-antitoxin system